MSQIDDVESIHSYMLNTPSKTPAAETIRTTFLNFYEKAGFWDKNLSTDWYDNARTQRNQFNLANAVSPAETVAVQKVLATGLTTEQQQGKPRPQVDVKTGKVGSQNKAATTLSAAGQPVLSRVLKKGLNGDDVKIWQTFLALTPATGYFDALTDTKTRAYQKAQALTADGAVGKLTWLKAFPIITTSQLAPAATADAFTSSAASPQFAPTQAPATSFAPTPGAPKAAPKSAPIPQAANPSPAAQAVKVATAGLVDFDPSKWSTGGKVVGAGAALLLVAGAVMHKKEEKARHGGHGHR
jgi:peptidoglycan hydrolase-like protein with peptidoglycan-binding domain